MSRPYHYLVMTSAVGLALICPTVLRARPAPAHPAPVHKVAARPAANRPATARPIVAPMLQREALGLTARANATVQPQALRKRLSMPPQPATPTAATSASGTVGTLDAEDIPYTESGMPGVSVRFIPSAPSDTPAPVSGGSRQLIVKPGAPLPETPAYTRIRSRDPKYTQAIQGPAGMTMLFVDPAQSIAETLRVKPDGTHQVECGRLPDGGHTHGSGECAHAPGSAHASGESRPGAAQSKGGGQ